MKLGQVDELPRRGTMPKDNLVLQVHDKAPLHMEEMSQSQMLPRVLKIMRIRQQPPIR